jgi:hypothetical protein
MHFTHWLQQKQIPDPDKITALIHQAGSTGIPENQLRGQVDLPWKVFNELLQALVSSRVVRVMNRAGVRWYFGW